jgi:hypothetical protein
MDGVKRRALACSSLVFLLCVTGCPNPLLTTVKELVAKMNAKPAISVSVDETAVDPDSSVSFGSIPTGTHSSKTFTITNTGDGALTLLSSPAVGTSGDAAFSVTTQPAAKIEPGKSATFVVQFAPSTKGGMSSTLTISSDDPDHAELSFDVTGTATGSSIQVYRASPGDMPSGSGVYAFPDTPIDSDSAPVTFTIKNLGVRTLTLTPPVQAVGDCRIDTQPSTSTIPAAGTATFTVVFHPTVLGARSGTVSIVSNDQDTPTYTFTVTGQSIGFAVMGVLQGSTPLANGTGSYYFGDSSYNNENTDVIFTIENTASGGNAAPLTLSGTPRVHLSDATSFSIVYNPASSIDPGDTSNFTIRFHPSSGGLKTCVVSIPNNDVDQNPYTFTVKGYAPAVALLATLQVTSVYTGDDGALQKGYTYDPPEERFSTSGIAGTTDYATGLAWYKSSTSTMTYADALTYVAGLTGDGRTWRLPNLAELESLLNAQESNQVTWLGTCGITVSSNSYWTSSNVASNPSRQWVVSFSDHLITQIVKTDSSIGVLAVSGVTSGHGALPKTGESGGAGQAWPSPRFIDNGDGTITDDLTGLMWQKQPTTSTKLFDKAMDYANDLSFATYTDWRVPNRKELMSLINLGETNLAAWLNSAGFVDVQAGKYWTSTHSPVDDMVLYTMDLSGGGVYEPDGDWAGAATEYVWAVRGR